ncbi:MAG: hypothetical protein U5L95_00650 [Candidatus Saccharibacteria bacterium]|nr:hypothetical protein [Candidatus Saccharibacteria bacterium]
MEFEDFESPRSVNRMERIGRWAGAVGLGLLGVAVVAERVFGVSTELFEAAGQSINGEVAGGFGLLVGAAISDRGRDRA